MSRLALTSRLPRLLMIAAGSCASPHALVAQAVASPPAWVNTIDIRGTLDTEFAWVRRPPTPLAPVTGTDAYVRRVELAFNGNPVPWITAFTLFSSEFVGRGGTAGATALTVEEAHLDLGGDGPGPYAVIGLRTQPFGLFENRLMKDPLTSDLYSTDAAGITVGLLGSQGLDASFTLYRGGEMLDAFLASAVLDGGSLSRIGDEASSLSSIIVAASIAPPKVPLVVEASFESEAGRGARNNTANVAVHVPRLVSGHVSATVERFIATSRETLEHAARPYKDRGLSAGLTYQETIRPRQALGSANFKQRRSRIKDHPADVTVRYERFEDGGLSSHLGVLSVRDRAGVGFHLTLFEGQSSVYGAGELRWSRLRVPAALAPTSPGSLGEFFLGLGVSF
jgi:hypothetical protein